MSLFLMSPCYCPDATPADGMVATAKRVGLNPYLYGVGQTIANPVLRVVDLNSLTLMEERLHELKAAWQRPLPAALGGWPGQNGSHNGNGGHK